MQPITISIQGDYYDCQIYEGKLYLWTFDGTLKIVDWDALIKSMEQYEADRVTMKYSFMAGNFMYQPNMKFVFKDQQYRELMLARLNELRGKTIDIDEKDLSDFVISEHDALQDELPIDSQIYQNTIYVGVDSGVFSADIDNYRQKKKAFVNVSNEKLWDNRIVSMTANDYPQIALSCADDGLFEMQIGKDSFFNDPLKINSSFSSFASYSRGSVYNSSLFGDGALSEFSFIDNNRNRKERKWEDILIAASDIFKDSQTSSLSWSADDKIFSLNADGFEIAKYNPFAEDFDGKFTSLRQFDFEVGNDKVVGAGSALFGNILEFENRLLVIGSRRNESFTVNGPITRWRVYPRSKNYLNQLHVILDDRINIYSFSEDYFRDQREKRIGFRYLATRYNYAGRRTKYEDFPEIDDYGTYDIDTDLDTPF